MTRWKSNWMTTLFLGVAVSLTGSSSLLAQGLGVVTGSVVDSATRRPIEGAQVLIVGTTRGAMTNDAGRYAIRAVQAGAATLRVLRIGYAAGSRAVAIPAGDSVEVNFTMRAVAQQLSEVVITGYGTSQRREVSNAVVSVQGAEIVNSPIAGLDGALQGKAAGLQVIQNAGNPGNGITVRIRGSASLSASNQPLYVIDGMPMIREDYSQLDLAGQDVTAVTGISPDEIASIDILKDAAAAAIYGSRASNGVIMITTKRGQAGRPRISFNSYYGTQSVEKRVDMMNGPEYVEFMYEALLNDGYAEDEIPDQLGFDRSAASVDTDWQNEVLRSAPIANLGLQMSGGTDRVQYFLSGTLFDQEGTVIGSEYNRQNVRANLDFRASDRLALRTSIGLVREDNNRNENDNTLDGVITNAIADAPIIAPRLPDGSFTSTDDGLVYTNPLAIGSLDFVETRTFRALGNVEAEYNFTDRFKLTSRVGVDVLNLRDLRWDSPKIIGRYSASIGGVAQQGNNTAQRYLAESFATFNRGGGRSTLSLTGGGSVEWNRSELQFVRGEGFTTENFQYPGNAGKATDYRGEPSEHNLVSLFSRANVTLLDRYFLTASIRTDGSSRFGENNQYGLFPAASAAWMITDEPAFKSLARLGEFKLRASYGVTGNQGIGDDFAFLGRFSKANYSDEPGISPSAIENQDLKWETSREFDVGFDLYILNGRVGIIGDYYHKKTNDLLVLRPITRTSGFSSFWDNIGNIENKGYELGLTTTNFQGATTGGFRWTSDFNISWNQNRVTKLFRGEAFTSGLRSMNRIEEGVPLGAFYAISFQGVDPATGDAIFEDLDGDGEPTSADRKIVGSPHPTYFGGFGNTLSWKGFDLRAFFQFSHGAEVFNGMRIFSGAGGFYTDNSFADELNRWQQPGDITHTPRASWDGTSNAHLISSRFIEDGSYIRFQELTLSYQLPVSFARGARLASAKIFASGRNLHVWTDYLGYDPDLNSFGSSANTSLGTDFYAYPLARTLSIGISGDFR